MDIPREQSHSEEREDVAGERDRGRGGQRERNAPRPSVLRSVGRQRESKKREGERQRETETERETERETKRETEKKTEKDRDRERDKERDRDRDRENKDQLEQREGEERKILDIMR